MLTLAMTVIYNTSNNNNSRIPKGKGIRLWKVGQTHRQILPDPFLEQPYSPRGWKVVFAWGGRGRGKSTVRWAQSFSVDNENSRDRPGDVPATGYLTPLTEYLERVEAVRFL